MTESWMDTKNQIKPITIDTPFQVGPVNVYLIFSDALILVDTGPATTEARSQLHAGLRRHGVSIKDLDLLLLTHHHPDHMGMTAEVAEHAKVAGHHRLAPWLREDQAFIQERVAYLQAFYEKHGMEEEVIRAVQNQNHAYMSYVEAAPLEIPLDEGDSLDGLRDWRILETLGHAQTHLSLMRDADRTMVAGDHIIRHISSNALLEAPYEPDSERPRTLLQYREGMIKCRAASKIYSGHGDPVDDPEALIDRRLTEQEKKAAYIRSLIGTEALTATEITRRMYKGLYERQPGLTFSETLGHLDLLEEGEQVTVTVEDGLWMYHQSVNP